MFSVKTSSGWFLLDEVRQESTHKNVSIGAVFTGAVIYFTKPQCSAFGCNFPSKNMEINLHCFLKERRRRALWKKAGQLSQLPEDPRFYPQHFSVDSFGSFSRPLLVKELTGTDGFRRRLKSNGSQDLFLSGDELGEERDTKPEHTGSDPEFSLSSGESSQRSQESQTATDAQSKD